MNRELRLHVSRTLVVTLLIASLGIQEAQATHQQDHLGVCMGSSCVGVAATYALLPDFTGYTGKVTVSVPLPPFSPESYYAVVLRARWYSPNRGWESSPDSGVFYNSSTSNASQTFSFPGVRNGDNKYEGYAGVAVWNTAAGGFRYVGYLSNELNAIQLPTMPPNPNPCTVILPAFFPVENGEVFGTLKWTVSAGDGNGMFSCSPSGASGGIAAWMGGSTSLYIPGVSATRTETCTISCWNCNGGFFGQCSKDVKLLLRPTCGLSLPASITAGSDGVAWGTATWSSVDADSGTYSCTTLPQGNLFPLSGSGSLGFANVTAPRTELCKLFVTNAAGSGSCSATVELKPSIQKPTVVTLAISPLTVSPGQSVTATWSGNNSPTSYFLTQTSPSLVKAPQGTATSLTQAAPETLGTYTYLVSACNDAGCGESPPVTLTVFTPAPPGAAVWKVKDSSGPILTIDSLGNAFLVPSSQIRDKEAPPTGLSGAFLLKRGAERVFAFKRDVTYLKGIVVPGQLGQPTLTGGSGRLAIKNGSGQIVAVFDGPSGNLYLRGVAVGGQ